MGTRELEAVVAELAYQRPGWLIWWSELTCRFWGLGWMLNNPRGPVWVTGQNPGEFLQHIDYLERLYLKHPAPWRESLTICPGEGPYHVA